MENIQCPKCGTDICEGDKFCKKCGEKTIYFKEEVVKKQTSDKKMIIIGVSVIAIIALTAIGIVCSKNKTEKVNKEEADIIATEKIEENDNTETVKEEDLITEQENIQTEEVVQNGVQKEVKNEVQNEVQSKEPVSEPIAEGYVKYTVNGNVYESPFCDFSYTVPTGWTMLSETQISEIIAPPTEKSVYEFVTQDNENSILIKVLVEKPDSENMTIKDYMNYIMIGIKSSGMEKISDNKTKEIAGKSYSVLEIGEENSDTRINCYLRKKEDRMICIMVTYSAGKETILDRNMSYFKEF